MADVIHYYKDEETGTMAVWHGGEYVQLYTEGDGVAQVIYGDAVPYDVVNVWDYETDTPTIEPAQMGAVVREHLDYAGETD